MCRGLLWGYPWVVDVDVLWRMRLRRRHVLLEWQQLVVRGALHRGFILHWWQCATEPVPRGAVRTSWAGGDRELHWPMRLYCRVVLPTWQLDCALIVCRVLSWGVLPWGKCDAGALHGTRRHVLWRGLLECGGRAAMHSGAALHGRVRDSRCVTRAIYTQSNRRTQIESATYGVLAAPQV